MSTSSINDFKEAIVNNKGLARSNRFKVEITDVPGWSGSTTGKSDLTILCDSVTMPGKNIETIEYSLYRNRYKVPTGYANEDVTITFNLTQNYLAKDALDSWINSIINVDSYLLSFDSVYKKDISIFQLDLLDKTVYKVKLKEAYPYQVESIDLSNQNEDSISTISAQFTYSTIEISKT